MPTAIFVPTLILEGNLYLWTNNNLPVRVVPDKNLIFFIIAALIGGWLGAALAGIMPVQVLKRIFAIFLLAIAAYMFFKN